MNIDNHVIETIEELEAFLHLVESGALGLEGVTGVALAPLIPMVVHLLPY